MTLTSADLIRPADHVEVCQADGHPVGFFRLRRRTELAWLEDLWIDPPAMGQGYGRRAFERAADVARGWGKGVMEWESDPFAEPFYLHLAGYKPTANSGETRLCSSAGIHRQPGYPPRSDCRR